MAADMDLPGSFCADLRESRDLEADQKQCEKVTGDTFSKESRWD